MSFPHSLALNTEKNLFTLSFNLPKQKFYKSIIDVLSKSLSAWSSIHCDIDKGKETCPPNSKALPRKRS